MKPPRRHREGSRRGFSMIEVIISVMIVGVLAAVATPRIVNSISSYRADAAAERLTADLELAASYARDHGTSETVTFSASAPLKSASGV